MTKTLVRTIVVTLVFVVGGIALGQIIPGPHTDPVHGVHRVLTSPPSVGACIQCHDTHGDQEDLITPEEPVLFRANDNNVCFDTSGVGGCHNNMALNYPLPDYDFMPDFSSSPSYPEANAGGDKIHGVDYRGRWPGSYVYDSTIKLAGRYTSPHRNDIDMPMQDSQGNGLCLNCHSPHGTLNEFDQLTGDYRGMEGHADFGAPTAYDLCFDCHSSSGPMGMNTDGRLIQDFYDESLNPQTAGHQIRRNPEIAISWPSWVQVGDKMPCFICHNPHGSQGNNGSQPNAFLLNDAIPDWSGITDPRHVASEARRVCFGCHIPSDGIPGSRTVMGIVMNTIPNKGAHRSFATRNCMEVHGDMYGSGTSWNIHNPIGDN